MAELTELFDLSDILNRPFGKLSGGQKRRVDVARALLHRPSILILDEPTTSLDPQTIKMVWTIIDDLRKREGMTVFLTTHYMEEAADADYIVILDSGKIAAEGTPLELKNQFTVDYIYLYADEEAVKRLGKPYEKVGDGFRVTLRDTVEATELIVKYPEVFVDYEIVKGKMDDVFLNATGKNLGGENA
jgi:multidrug/hemolysin transport system ATP-binding protein